MRLNIDDDAAQKQAEVEAVQDFLIPSLFSLLFCCGPAIFAVIFAVLTKKAKARGDLEGALKNSTNAKVMMIIAFVFGVIAVIGRLMSNIK